MDDWCAGITRKLLRNAEESALPFVFFIFFANYILLNIMLAISCDQMKEVSHHQTIFEGECDSLSSFSSKTNDYKEFTTKNSLKTILSNLLKLIEFKHAFFYSKLIKNVKLKEFLAKKIISDNENEISLYFLLKEINRKNKTNIQENEKDLDVFIIEYKGKIVKTTQKKVMIRINKNVEFLIHSKHISYAEKQKKNMRFDIMNLTKSKFFLDKNNEEDIGNELEKLIK